MKMRLALIAVLAVSTFAAAEEWNRTYKVGESPTLNVTASDAGIEVHAGAAGQISASLATTNLSLIGSDPDVRVMDSQVGDNVTITAKQRSGRHICIFCVRSAHMTITAPAGTKLYLKTSDGSIRIYDFKAPADLNTSDGSIETYGFDGTLHAKTSDGHITAEGRFDDLRLQTSDGSITVRAARGSKVANDWRLQTSDGSIRAALPEDVDAMVNLHTGDGGIHCDLPINGVHGPMSRHQIAGKFGSGGRLLEMRTSDGSIHVTRI